MIEDVKKLREEVVRLITTTQDSDYQPEFYRDLFEVAYNLNDLIISFESERYLQPGELQYVSDEDMFWRLSDAVERYHVDMEYADFIHAKQLSKRFSDTIKFAENYFNSNDEGKVAAFSRTPAFNFYKRIS